MRRKRAFARTRAVETTHDRVFDFDFRHLLCHLKFAAQVSTGYLEEVGTARRGHRPPFSLSFAFSLSAFQAEVSRLHHKETAGMPRFTVLSWQLFDSPS